MNYIRYQEAEKLFQMWPLLEAIRGSSLLELEAAGAKESIGTDEDYIYNLAIGNKVMSDMPFATTNEISHPTENIACNYPKIMKNDLRSIRKEIKEEILQLWLVDEKLKLAYKTLSPIQQHILKLYYWDKKTWSETLEDIKKEKLFCSKSQAQKHRKDGIEKIAMVSKITMEMYTDILKIVEGNVEA